MVVVNKGGVLRVAVRRSIEDLEDHFKWRSFYNGIP